MVSWTSGGRWTARRQSADAGVPSPRVDAELLAAHLLGVSRSEIARRALLGGSAARDRF